ncbi:MAG: thiamine biosynthesis protein ThiS [Chloroflexi bacterium]|nr:thiamine biosynthesis protein ThiS [Chloroflexota bacterium]
MKVIIRQPRRREVAIQGGRQVSDIMKELQLNPENFIAIQGRVLLTRDAFVKDDETIEILSAISGGA